MRDDDPLPVDADRIERGIVVADVIVHETSYSGGLQSSAAGLSMGLE
jgi:hypothetical protein